MSKSPYFPRVCLVLFSLSIGLISIWDADVKSRDEVRVAGIAREMDLRGEYAVPRLNGEPFLEYPALGYWMMAFLLQAFGSGSFVVHLQGVFYGVATVWLTFLIGRSLGGERVGLLAGFMLMLSMGFVGVNRISRVDPALVFAINLALYGFVAGCRTPEGRSGQRALFYFGMGLGFLAKGLIGVGIPAAVVAVDIVVRRDVATLRRTVATWGAVLLPAPVLVWAFFVYSAAGAPAIEEVLRQSIWRFFSSSAHHAEPFYFYLRHLPLVVLPAALVLLPFAWLHARSSSGRALFRPDPAALLPLIWFVVVFAVLSVASAKRVVYLAPIYPAFAILAALAWERVRKDLRIRRGWERGIVVAALPLAVLVRIVAFPPGAENSYRVLFERVTEESVSAPVALYRPNETLRGAAVYYLGKTVETFASENELRPALTTPGSRTILVVFHRREKADPLEGAGPESGVRLCYDLPRERRGGGWRIYEIAPRDAPDLRRP